MFSLAVTGSIAVLAMHRPLGEIDQQVQALARESLDTAIALLSEHREVMDRWWRR